ncbi:MAG TPA: indole-3-glycerol-phosphate synthase TrpC, partial [Clostridia bacterium]|nr:indole-3-glycerol-phosphate synthase TrpC [Clostridia bacterium]
MLEIAERRRRDLAARAGETTMREQLAAAAAAPAPRPVAERFAAAGLHVIAEIKRSSPSAGTIAAAGDDIVARARAY